MYANIDRGTMADVSKLYDCFTPAEMQRLHEIKSSPEWVPNYMRGVGVYAPRGAEARIQVGISMSDRVAKRAKAWCASRGISLSYFIETVVEAIIS